jgi:pantoate--beta-alanine ligase
MVKDLDLDVTIVSCPTVREKDGLAMSSRNSYLSPDQRKQALCLYEALQEADSLFSSGERTGTAFLQAMTGRITIEPDAEIDYVALVHPETLVDLEEVNDRALAALAVRIGKTRLIDNMLLQGRSA